MSKTVRAHIRQLSRIALSGLIAAVTVQVPVQQAQAAQAAPGASYYVDASGGDDTASGRTADQAWKSLARVSTSTFRPGDAILLKAGEHWTGQLWPKGSGAAGAPITVDRYGTGAKPRIDGAGVVGDVVRLFNQEYWTVRNLEITNTVPAAGAAGANLRDLRGIHVSGDNSQTLDGFVIDGVDVHDVTGEVNWISGSVSGNAPGVHFQTGWDGSKKTGGIVFDTTVTDINAPPTTPTILNDVVVENSTISNTSFAGIVVKQYTGDGKNAAGETIATATGWGTRTSASDPRFAPHTNIVIRGNFITQAATDYGCNGIYLTNVRGAIVERNVVHRTGTSGIETYYADDVTIQFNEVYETTPKAGGADSNGIDPDKGTTKQVVQYNYLHHNGDGILLCQFAFGDAIVRGNVLASNSRYQIYLHSDRAAAAKIYHNTVYSNRSNYLVYGYGSALAASYDLTNNVFYSTRAGAALTTSTTIRYDSNLYGGATLDIPDDDTHAIVADPFLTDRSVSGPYGTAATGPQLATAHAFTLRAASPAIDAGVVIAGNGGRDFAGAALHNGPPDLGAFEYATPAASTTETVAGSVRDTHGAPVAGATVAAGSSTTTSGSDGWFAIPDVPFADGVTVTAARNGYRTTSQAVDVRTGNRTTVHLALAPTSVVGAISGRVLDQTGAPLTAAALTVRDGDQSIGTGVSAADGTFTVTDVPAGDGYTLTATFPGLNTASQPGLSVMPATTTAARALLLSTPVPDYLDVHNFDAIPAGTLTTGTNGLVVSPAGGRVDVVEVPSAVDHSARLTRTTNSGSTSLQRNFTPALTGLVTVEAQVMRDDPYASGNNWYSVPYIRGTNGVNAISLAFTKNTIVAYSGAGTVTVGAYKLGRWYHLRTVIDVANQRFDLYLDGAKVLTGAAFRAPMDGVAQIDYYANSSNYGSVHLDDLRVSQGVGLLPDDAGLLTLATDHGVPTARPGGGYLLEVPATVTAVAVSATARSPFARSVGIEETVTAGTRATSRIALGDTGAHVAVVVTAEDGTAVSYPLEIRKPSLAVDTSLSGLVVDVGDLEPAFAPDVLAYSLTVDEQTSRVTVTPTVTNPRATVTVAGGPSPGTVAVPAGTTDIAVLVVSEDGTANATYTITVTRPGPQLPQDGATTVPGGGVLSSTSGWATGLHDGTYDVVMNMWWGSNASVFVLYENGVEIARSTLTPAGSAAQRAAVPITGRANGSYVYTGELLNQAGRTATTSVTVVVKDAAPGKPVLSDDNWDHNGDYTVATTLWWGTNATTIRLYENGVLVDTQDLVAASPARQHAATAFTERPAGSYTYVAELANAAGTTRSEPLVVVVN
jgi:hypothetical protein